ncbi:retrovirus-related pol polyprotein from transposon TNT 1-94 [Tanacetum coccineum]
MIYTALCYKFCFKHEKKQEEDKSVPVIMAGDQYAQFIAMPCVGVISSALALQALRRLGSIFTSVYAVYQKLKKAYKYEMFCFTSRRFTRWDKRLLYVKRNKEISLEKDLQDSPNDEEDTRSSHEYLNDLEEEYQARALLAKSKRPTKYFEAKYNKVKAKLDEEEVSSDDNEMVEVKVLIALAEDNDAISKEVTCINMWNNQDLKWCLEMTLHAQLKVIDLSNVMFDEKRGTIFNSNKEVVMTAPRVRDVYVLDMTSSAQESCFFAKSSNNLNWIWHKRLAYLNIKTINKLANKILLLVFPYLSTQRTNHVHHVKRESIIGNSILINFYDEKGIS